MDSQFLSLIATSVVTFLAIANPIANAPIFLSLTQGDDQQTIKAVALRAVLVAFGVLLVVAIFGQFIWQLFGITLPAFRITAGILVFMIGYGMISGESHGSQMDDNSEHTLENELNKAVSPMGVPILAGGGTISATMNLTAEGLPGTFAAIIGFTLVLALSYIVFIKAQTIVNKLGRSALNIMTRAMGLILATIGVQIFIDGVTGVLQQIQAA